VLRKKLLSRLKEQRGSVVNELDFSNLNLRSTPADMIHARISVTGCIRKYIRPVLLRCVSLYTMEVGTFEFSYGWRARR